MTLIERLRGCPDGATRGTLRLRGHSDEEISEALVKGMVEREVRIHAKPHNLAVEWFKLKKGDPA